MMRNRPHVQKKKFLPKRGKKSKKNYVVAEFQTMGANVSAQTQKSISSIVTNAMNRVVTDISTELVTQGRANQRVQLNARGAKVRGNIVINQNSNVSIQAVSQIQNQQANKLANDVQNEIITKLQAAAEQKNEGLNLGQVNTQIQNQEIRTYVTNNLSNIIETNVRNVVTNDASVDQTVWVNLAYIDLEGDVVISQEAIIKNISNNVAKQLFDNTLGNTAKTKVLQDMRAKAKQTNEGLSFALLGIILVICVGGYFVYKNSTESGGEPSPILKYMPYILGIATAVCGAAAYYMYYKSEDTAMKICLGCTALALVGAVASYIYIGD